MAISLVDGFASLSLNDGTTRPKLTFLSLPLELRVAIYSYLLPDAGILIPANLYTGHLFRKDGSPCSVKLLRACKQIHDEMVDQLYRSIVVEVDARVNTTLILGTLRDSEVGQFLNDSSKGSSPKERAWRAFPSVFRYIRRIKLVVEIFAPRNLEKARDWKCVPGMGFNHFTNLELQFDFVDISIWLLENVMARSDRAELIDLHFTHFNKFRPLKVRQWEIDYHGDTNWEMRLETTTKCDWLLELQSMARQHIERISRDFEGEPTFVGYATPAWPRIPTDWEKILGEVDQSGGLELSSA